MSENTPLGTVSQHQLEKGRVILEKIAHQLRLRNPHGIVDLTNEYYTIIPHSFGRGKPKPIDNEELLQLELKRIDSALSGEYFDQYVWQFDSKHGWFDFDSSASEEVDSKFLQRSKNPNFENEKVVVKSGSDEWKYLIDFNNMTQTNMDHQNHRTRNIRRVSISESRPAISQ